MIRRDERGFTLLEVIAVLLVLGVLVAVVVTRSSDLDADLYSATESIKTHLRYAQTQAMNKTSATVLVWGLTCDGTSYWMFEGTDTNQVYSLPDEATGADKKVALSGKKVSLTAFTVFFDWRGVPYSAYTDASSNTPLAAPLSLTVTGQGGGTRNITITPLTGYIQ